MENYANAQKRFQTLSFVPQICLFFVSSKSFLFLFCFKFLFDCLSKLSGKRRMREIKISLSASSAFVELFSMSFRKRHRKDCNKKEEKVMGVNCE
jgi:hypothetical protein